MSPKNSRNHSRKNAVRLFASLLTAALCVPALLAQSSQFPTYQVGPQTNGTYIVSSGQVISPAGKQIDLGIRVRAKAIAVNPNVQTHTAAVLTMGTRGTTDGAVEIFDTITGAVLQHYIYNNNDPNGSYAGIEYSADGKYLVFSEGYNGYVEVATVNAQGLLQDYAQVNVPFTNQFIPCFPNSPPGSYGTPCGSPWGGESVPGSLAISPDSKSAYVVLNENNTLAKIDLTANPPVQTSQVAVGNAPHTVLLSADGQTAYVSNEGGRVPTKSDFQIYSGSSEIVADPFIGAAVTGTVSVVDVPTLTLKATIKTGLHPTGMAFWGERLLVANAYSDTLSVVNTWNINEVRRINLGLPIGVPGEHTPIYGAAPNAIAVDEANNIAYVALYNANAIAVVDLRAEAPKPSVLGLIPVAYAPSFVVLDRTRNELLVANDKGIGARNSFETDHGVTDYNTHQDNGTVSIIPLPKLDSLSAMTQQVYQNNHWDLTENIASSAGGNRGVKPTAIPRRIGDPSPIKHVFLIIRENRTYDQILGDVAAGNGDPSLAVFGGKDTPNVHALVQRFPLLDNFYDPSRQSADGHQWITEGLAPYSDDIQSPDWNRSYAGGNAGDALVYQKKGFLFSEAEKAGLRVKLFGEYVENTTYVQPNGSTDEPSWSDFYNDALAFEAGKEKTLYYQNTPQSFSSLPTVSNYLVKNFPQFDTGIPDQFRVDLWQQDFNHDLAAGTVPALSILWVMCDHTGGPPTPDAEQADNDLAVGRMIDSISHSPIWSSSAIFIEEDDAQDGVDHVDGHRSPGYIVSPYAVQYGPTDHTTYTQVNMTRTIEQILGLTPMNQFDLVASPMLTAFVDGVPPAENFKPWTHVPNQVPLDEGVTASTAIANLSPAVQALQAGWLNKKAQIFAGKLNKPDSEDPDTVNHLNWYMSTRFTRPYPGEKTVRPASEFNRSAPTKSDND
jgi:DNA-binding beta-propeller fold protein YncE